MVANAPTFLDEERAPDNGTVDATRLPAVTVPILLSTGDETHPALQIVTDRLAKELPHAERATIPGAGHIPHRTHPREYAALLLGFWASSTPAAPAAAGGTTRTSAGSAC
jgi:pimeloyl-ACP methyl ester carboxylesterase